MTTVRPDDPQRTSTGSLRDALRLTRPRQWPILSAQLLVGVLLAPSLAALVRSALGASGAGATAAAAAGGNGSGAAGAIGLANASLTAGSLAAVAGGWFAWVVLLNGSTLAFNSAYDRDTGPVAYLARPPLPPRWVAGASAAAMAFAPVVGWLLVGPAFGVLTALCVLLSMAYSHPRFRWKSVPGLDLLVNVVGYGAGTTMAGVLIGLAAAAAAAPAGPGVAATAADIPGAVGNPGPDAPAALAGGPGPAVLVVGFGLLFGSLYPLTQLYQRVDDLRRGDRTLATALGPDRSLKLAIALGASAAATMLAGAALWRHGLGLPPLAPALLPLAAALVAWLGHLVHWWRDRRRRGVDRERRGMYVALGIWGGIDGALIVALLAA
ncbi:MAG: UbiA family prenyltransferase [Candidatus Krumholzibacteriia bacterium]